MVCLISGLCSGCVKGYAVVFVGFLVYLLFILFLCILSVVCVGVKWGAMSNLAVMIVKLSGRSGCGDLRCAVHCWQMGCGVEGVARAYGGASWYVGFIVVL